MIKIHVISQRNRHLYERTIQEYYRQRHDVFIMERGWTDIGHVDGAEYDAYDDEHAVYLLALDDERVVGGQRFYPTTRPHMLSEVFPHLSQWPLPQSPDTWECTRYFVARDRRVGRADVRLLVAMQQFCLEEGISHLTGVVELSALARWLQAGFKLRPLGLPENVGGEPTIAVVADITREGFNGLLGKLGVHPTPLIRRDLDVGMLGLERYAA